MTNNTFDATKRRTLKLLTGATAATLVGMPALAGQNTLFQPANVPGDAIECTLISRADLAKAYLLMHNTTNQDIVAARLNEQFIEFDNTVLNMADAYVEPVVVRANEKLMVRLDIKAGLQKVSAGDKAIDLNRRTTYLSQGTRIVSLPLRLHNGVGTIDDGSRLT